MTLLIPGLSSLMNISVGLACAVLGYLTFGHNELFDLVFMATLFLLIILNRRLANVWTAFAIVLFVWMIDKALFYLTTSHLLLDALVYIAMLALLLKFRVRHFKAPLLALLLVTVIAEGYWRVTSYDNKPDMYFYWSYVLTLVIAKVALELRTLWIERVFDVETDFTTLDPQLAYLFGVFLVIEIANIIEYLVRHLTDASPMLVYTYYTEAKHAIGVLLLFYALTYIIQLRQSQRIKA